MALDKHIQHKRQGSKPINYKLFAFAIKEPTVSGRKVSGYFAVFGNKDSDSDVIVKGAFAKSINDRGPQSNSGNKIAFLWQHDMKEPLGRITELKEDDFGLYFEAILDPIDIADRALTQLESGTLDKFSIGFQYVWDKMEYDENLDAFICRELTLFEGSVVTLAANDATYYAGLKSEDRESIIEDVQDELEKFCKSLSFPKQRELRTLMAKREALVSSQPIEDIKQSLKDQAAKKDKPKSKFLKLSQLKEN